MNDQFGHDIGDAFLIQYAHRLTSCIRTCDEAYRLGGDEFVILLRHIERREEIQQIMERIHRELQKNGVLNPAFYGYIDHWSRLLSRKRRVVSRTAKTGGSSAVRRKTTGEK